MWGVCVRADEWDCLVLGLALQVLGEGLLHRLPGLVLFLVGVADAVHDFARLLNVDTLDVVTYTQPSDP